MSYYLEITKASLAAITSSVSMSYWLRLLV